MNQDRIKQEAIGFLVGLALATIVVGLIALFAGGCAHAPAAPAAKPCPTDPGPWAKMSVVTSDGKLAHAITVVDENGEKHEVAQLTTLTADLTAFFAYVEKVIRLAEFASKNCVVK